MSVLKVGDSICWRDGRRMLTGRILASAERNGVLGYTVQVTRKDGTLGSTRHVSEKQKPFRWEPFVLATRRSTIEYDPSLLTRSDLSTLTPAQVAYLLRPTL